MGLSLRPFWHGVYLRLPATSLFGDDALITGIQAAHHARENPECVAEPERIGVVFSRIVECKLADFCEYIFSVEILSRPVVNLDDLVRKDDAEYMDINRNRKFPGIKQISIHK